MFSDKGSKFSRIILRLTTAFEKKSFSSVATSSSFVIRVLSSSASFTLSENRTLFDRKDLTDFPEAFLFGYIFAFHLNLYIFQKIKKHASGIFLVPVINVKKTQQMIHHLLQGTTLRH